MPEIWALLSFFQLQDHPCDETAQTDVSAFQIEPLESAAFDQNNEQYPDFL